MRPSECAPPQGFYRHVGEQMLVIGPYQGHHGCLRIAFSRGVCGAAARTRRTQLVPDVAQFPGHIACASRWGSAGAAPKQQQPGSSNQAAATRRQLLLLLLGQAAPVRAAALPRGRGARCARLRQRRLAIRWAAPSGQGGQLPGRACGTPMAPVAS